MNMDDYRSWYEKWESEGYDWDSLLKKEKSIEIDGKYYTYTEADFWRDEENNLITAINGKRYTKHHLTLYVKHDKEYLETDKLYWSDDQWVELKLQAETIKTYSMTSILKYNYPDINQQLGRKAGSPIRQYHGITIKHLSSRVIAEMNKMFFMCHVISDVLFYKQNIGNFNISNIYFSGAVTISSLQSDELFITNCIISGDLYLENIKTSEIGFKSDIKGILLSRIEVDFLYFNPYKFNVFSCNIKNVSVNKYANFSKCPPTIMICFSNCDFKGEYEFNLNFDNLSPDVFFEKKIFPFMKIASYSKLDIQRFEESAIFVKELFNKKNQLHNAGIMHRYELRLREIRLGQKDVNKYVLTIYRLSSNFGYSIAMPAHIILCVALFLSPLYFFFYINETNHVFSLNGNLDDLANSISFSFSQITPIMQWGAKDTGCKTIFGCLHEATGWPGLITHVIATTQTFLSSLLLFLFGLAGRRRFQISG